MNFSGKSILITGASSGLGEHFSRLFCADGAHVIMAARSIEKLERISREIREAGGSVSIVEMDVANALSVAQVFSALESRLDVVINNAGIDGAAPALTVAPEQFDSVLDTNLKGTFYVAQQAAQRLKETGGVIVNISSILGLRVAGGVAAYAASKAGVVQLTKALALEWARYGIRVNALCPGYVETPLNAEFFASDAGRKLIARIPQRRLGKLSDLDAPLKLLCSDEASYMTGAVLAVDGGHLVSGL